jgi:hypothetical protein
VALVWALFGALAVTIVVELAVAALFGLRTRPAIVTVVCINLITNPALNLAVLGLWLWEPRAYWPALAALEIAAVLVEWRLLLWALGGDSRRLLLVAACMNAASLSAGFLLWFA